MSLPIYHGLSSLYPFKPLSAKQQIAKFKKNKQKKTKKTFHPSYIILRIHLIRRIYTVCKFEYFLLWYLKLITTFHIKIPKYINYLNMKPKLYSILFIKENA